MPARTNFGSPNAARRLGIGALVFLSLATVCAARGPSGPAAPPAAPSAATALPAPPAGVVTPAAVREVVEIHPFRLREGFGYDWLRGRPLVSAGLLVVLRVDPAYVTPQNAAEPVLYAGDTTIQRLNQGDRSGYVVGLVPGEPDLSMALVFFGSPELPERVTRESAAAQAEQAARAGIKPFTLEQIASARREALAADDLAALLRGPAAALVLRYSPEERDLAETWRLPTAGSPGPR